MSCRCDVVIGGTHGVRLLTKLSICMSREVSLVGRTWSRFFILWSPQFGWVWCIWTTVRKCLVHLVSTCHVALVQCWLGVHLGWRDKLSTPKSIGYFFMCRGFIGGRGIARPLPHILAPLPSSRSSPEEEGLALLLILPVCTWEG